MYSWGKNTFECTGVVSQTEDIADPTPVKSIHKLFQNNIALLEEDRKQEHEDETDFKDEEEEKHTIGR